MVELEHRPFRLEHPTEPGRIVRGSIDLPRPGGRRRPHAILLHGFKGFAAWGFFPEIARRIAERGFVVVRFVEFVAHAFGANAFAGDAFFVDVEDIVLVGGRTGF